MGVSPPQLAVGVSPPLTDEVVMITVLLYIITIGEGDVPHTWTGAYGFGLANTIAVTLRTFALAAAIDRKSGWETGGCMELVPSSCSYRDMPTFI